jgi:hypothetical protein
VHVWSRSCDTHNKVTEMSDEDAFEKIASMASLLTKPAIAKRVDGDCARRAKRARRGPGGGAESATRAPIPVEVTEFRGEPF